MTLKTPDFWYRPESSKTPFIEYMLTPASWIYSLAAKCHQLSKKPKKLPVPVLCVGNINAGGTGKTPVAIAIMKRVKSLGLAAQPFFLTRGYGGAEYGPLLVDTARHSAWDVGDEALLLVQEAPTIVSADRAQGAAFAISKGADLIIMDDGLQNPGIFKDIQCVVIGGEMGFGNKKILPAGPLREPIEPRIQQADFFVITGKDQRGMQAQLPAGKPVLNAELDANIAHHTHPRYVAFAGLGYPEKFFSFLKHTLNLNILEEISFPDHYPYAPDDLERLKTAAIKYDAKLITTPKDTMRLPNKMDTILETVYSYIHWKQDDQLNETLRNVLDRKNT